MHKGVHMFEYPSIWVNSCNNPCDFMLFHILKVFISCRLPVVCKFLYKALVDTSNC